MHGCAHVRTRAKRQVVIIHRQRVWSLSETKQGPYIPYTGSSKPCAPHTDSKQLRRFCPNRIVDPHFLPFFSPLVTQARFHRAIFVITNMLEIQQRARSKVKCSIQQKKEKSRWATEGPSAARRAAGVRGTICTGLFASSLTSDPPACCQWHPRAVLQKWWRWLPLPDKWRELPKEPEYLKHHKSHWQKMVLSSLCP